MAEQDLPASELFARCAQSGDEAAWAEFVRRYHSLITGCVVKTLAARGSFSADQAEEMVQEVYKKLCAQERRVLRQYANRETNSDFGYLKVVTINTVIDALRRLRADRPEGGFVALEANSAPAAPDGSRALLVAEIQRVAHLGATQRDSLIFDLFYRVGLTAQEISRFPTVDLSVKGIESVIHRLTTDLRQKFSAVGKGKSNKGASS